jgi:hypothetical protein
MYVSGRAAYERLNVALSRHVLTRLFARSSNTCHDDGPEHGWVEQENRERERGSIANVRVVCFHPMAP